MRVSILLFGCAFVSVVGCVPGSARGSAAEPARSVPPADREPTPPAAPATDPLLAVPASPAAPTADPAATATPAATGTPAAKESPRRFTFEEIALELSRIPIDFDGSCPSDRAHLRERLAALWAMGYRGPLRVEGHAPDYCLSGKGSLALAPDDWPLRRCRFSDEEYGLAIADRMATCVKKLLEDAGFPRDALSTIGYGMERPIVSQPEPGSPEARGWTAGRWNAAAHVNRRVSVTLDRGPDFVECRVDGDCPSGAACRAGACTRLPASPPAGAAELAPPSLSCSGTVPVADDYSVSEATAGPLLDELAACIRATSARYRVTGHTDERGTDEFNLGRGFGPAVQVARLLEQRGVDGKRLEVLSRGEDQPVCVESDAACWTRNRRVEIEPLQGSTTDRTHHGTR